MIKERILQVIDFKGFKKEDFFNKIGMTSANFRGKAKERPINSIAVENIFTVIPDLSLTWLLTGKGEMLVSEKSEKGEKAENNELQKEINDLYKEKFILLKENSELQKKYVAILEENNILQKKYLNLLEENDLNETKKAS
ncbi:hypothetical protein [Tenacibaculum finnmarkense]|uniref:hypothetical protein n=1 Tax=Tenacibaculum finnmarkense TaxID=2781243 RepID=UPI001E50D0A7|nr:hypothetical protein [Tenacibaculum finnmarkense]MCD8410366.1 hypothetical protein [Tenacibaculum finnmarkense genomovar ulcerans]